MYVHIANVATIDCDITHMQMSSTMITDVPIPSTGVDLRGYLVFDMAGSRCMDVYGLDSESLCNKLGQILSGNTSSQLSSGKSIISLSRASPEHNCSHFILTCAHIHLKHL